MPRDGDHPPAGEATDLRSRLRARVAPLHARLDQAIAAACLGTPPDLPRLLRIHHRALGALLPALAQAGAARLFPGWEGGSRLVALEADLAALGAAPPAPATTRPCFVGEPEAWGALYALEGSRLGNRVLSQRLAPLAGAATRFLGHRAPEEAGWPRLVARLAALDLRGAEFEAACGGAHQVFEAYLDAVARTAPCTAGGNRSRGGTRRGA